MKRKATVLEIKNGQVALLRDDGIFVRRKNKNYSIGDVIMVEEQSFWQNRWLSSAVAAVLLLAMVSTGTVVYANPTYYISIDTNPGIVLEVNRFERVVQVRAVNEEAEAVLHGLALKNMSAEEAVGKTMDRMSEMGYLASAETNIVISTSAKDAAKAGKMSAKLQETAAKELAENHNAAQVTANTTGLESVEAAKAIEGMTPGKYNIVANQLGKNPEEYVEVSIQDIMKEIKAAQEEAKPTPPGQENKPVQPEQPETPENPNQPTPQGQENKPVKPTPPGQENKPTQPAQPTTPPGQENKPTNPSGKTP